MEDTKPIRKLLIEELKGKIAYTATGFLYSKEQFSMLMEHVIRELEEHFMGMDEVVELMREYGVDPTKPKPAIPHDVYAKWLTDKYNSLNDRFERSKHALRDAHYEIKWLQTHQVVRCQTCRERDVPVPSGWEAERAELEKRVDELSRTNDLLRSSNRVLFDHVIFGMEEHPQVVEAKRKSLMVRIIEKFHCSDKDAKHLAKAMMVMDKMKDEIDKH